MELVGTDMWLQRARGSRLYDDLFDEVRPQAGHSRTLGSSKGTEYEQLWLQMERRDNALREHQRKRHKLLWMGSCTHTDQVPEEQRGREGRKGGRAPWAWRRGRGRGRGRGVAAGVG